MFNCGGLIVNENKDALYLNMFLGTIGTILLLLSGVRYSIKEGNNSVEDAMIFFGFILAINYINFLEKKAGISNKLTWIRVGVSIVLFGACSFFLLK
jgi:hypothetical protein